MNGGSIDDFDEDSLSSKSNRKSRSMAKRSSSDLPGKRLLRQIHSETSSNSSSITGAKYLGSMLKNDLGEILRRSCRERKSNTRFNEEVSSSTSKSVPNSPEKKGLRPKSLPESTPKRTRRHSVSEGSKPKKKLSEETIKPQKQNGETLRGSGRLLTLRPLSLSSSASATGSGSSVVSQAETVPVKKKYKPFKGGTYAMSVHGASSKKKKYKYKAYAKAKSDLDQTDAEETSKSSFFEKQISDDESQSSIKDSDQEKMVQHHEKTMPILTESNNFENVSAVDSVEPPVLEMQVDKMDSSILEKKSQRKEAFEMCCPFVVPFPPTHEALGVPTVYLDQLDIDVGCPSLCTCRSPNGFHIYSRMKPGTFCEGVDCIDDRLIGCANMISSVSVFRPSVRAPYQALCELHRHRMRFHQSCPRCGLFCTQGTFIQCRADPKKAVHHAHKNCLLVKNGVEVCPHCGQSSHLQTVHLELNAPKSTSIFQTQQLPFRKEPGARIAFTRGMEFKENVMEEDSCLPSKSCKISDSGKEISSVGLPVGPERSRLEKVIDNLSSDGSSVTNLSTENMFNAAKSGDVEKILQMLMLGFDANTKFYSSDKQTVLHVAAANGHLMLVHVLIQAGAAVNAMDNSLMTPIMSAIEKGHVSVAQYLIKAGVQLDTRGEDAMTALHLAAKYGLLDVVKHILDTGKVNVNVQDDGGWTPLIWACEFKHTTVVKFVLENGADSNSRDKEQNIALHWSAFSGSLEISEMLLNRGCDINARNIHGDAPLHVAARQDKYECVMLFLARNADVDIVNKEKETPIMCCEDRNSQTWLALSMTKHLKKISGSCPTRSEVVLFNDVSRGRENIPIQCVNAFDNEASPSDYLYIRENCEAIPITMDRSITSLQSCQCEDDCASSSCGCSSMSFRCWYTKSGRLVDEFNFIDPPMIFECNRACRCFTTCSNRVLQNGITCRLQLFRTKVKGWGVRTLRDIPRGTFICEYVGEVISDLEADRREDDSYLFDLDNKDRESYCIDARYYGNISRFINHSCEPNLIPVKIFVDYQDHRFPRIALFSGRSIKANEELGFDYGCKFWIIKCRSFMCACESEKCKYSEKTIQQTLSCFTRRHTEGHAE